MRGDGIGVRHNPMGGFKSRQDVSGTGSRFNPPSSALGPAGRSHRSIPRDRAAMAFGLPHPSSPGLSSVPPLSSTHAHGRCSLLRAATLIFEAHAFSCLPLLFRIFPARVHPTASVLRIIPHCTTDSLIALERLRMILSSRHADGKNGAVMEPSSFFFLSLHSTVFFSFLCPPPPLKKRGQAMVKQQAGAGTSARCTAGGKGKEKKATSRTTSRPYPRR